MPPKSQNGILINANELRKSTLNPEEPENYLKSKLAVPEGLLPSKPTCWSASGCFATSAFLFPVAPVWHLELKEHWPLLEQEDL